MTPAQLQTIEEIYRAALDQEPDQISAYLDTACGGDEVLRRKVEALLSSREQAADFIETSAVGLATKIIQTGQGHSLVGQTIGHYKISERIGSGGMGEVYLAIDVIASRKAALKLLPYRFTGEAERLKRFRREARAVVALNHPNILTVYEIGQDHSTHYIASELIEGETLRQRLDREHLQVSEAVDVAIQVASALAAAHEAGIVHRDIKPENIMLRPDGYVKVLDFGVAKLTEQEAPATMPQDEALLLVETNLGAILGTVRYMSPEQACGAQVDQRTDVWSLGVVLYEMVTGQAPFTGDTPKDVMSAILEKEPPPLTRYGARIPAELQQIISKTLRKDRDQRYQTTPELLQALKHFRRKLEAKSERAAAPLWLRWARSPATLMLILVIAGLAVTLPLYRHRNVTTSSPIQKSIAVLPFENLSDEKDNAFFADGVQDELLSNLSKIKDLKVISRTSVMQYKAGVARNLKEIAQQLGVSNMVEGSVRRSGNRIRVSVQLIDALTDRRVWAQKYDRTLADSLSSQGDLATEIAAEVGATLSPQEKSRVGARPTNNPAAYDAFLRGRAFRIGTAWSENADGAIRSYQEAVKLDPNFALAWAYLSCAQSGSYWTGSDHNSAKLAPAKEALDHAVALDPNLPETHLALGYYRYYGQRDFTGALAEFRQAEQGLPNNVDILQALVLIQRRVGRWDEAVEAGRHAVELDPRNVVSSIVLAETYEALRRFPEALATAERVLALESTNTWALWIKAAAFWAKGDLDSVEPLLDNPGTDPLLRAFQALFRRRYPTAIEIFSKAVAAESTCCAPFGSQRLLLGLSQQSAGDVAAARATYQGAVEDFQRLLKEAAHGFYTDPQSHGNLGLAYAGLGEAAAAIAEGQKAMAVNPSSKDAFDGPEQEDRLARIYAQLGDADHAIPILKRLLQTPYAVSMFLTPGLLRLDPIWDKIRNDARFEELAAENAPVPEKSIAVLPFENLSKDEESAFFAGGVQDEILTNLAKVADLKVISRTSVMKYKSDLERNLREIAKTLGVSHVVEGSVQRTGGRVRVNVQLIDARHDAHVWAEHYDRDSADVFAIQSEIAQQIAKQLRAKLSPAEKAAIAERPTADVAAYALYTEAKGIEWYDWDGVDRGSERKIRLLEKAIQRDPSFALAYAALAWAQFDLFQKRDQSDLSQLDLAKQTAETALRLEPDLGEAHLALATCYYHVNLETGDFDRVREEVALARRTLPNDSEAIALAARVDKRQHRWEDALANLRRASELDPAGVGVTYTRRRTLLEMRRYHEWEQALASDVESGAVKGPRTQLYQADFKLAQGDPVAAQAFLAQVPLEFSPFEWVWRIRFEVALCLRDYDGAAQAIAATPAKFAHVHNGQPPESWADGLVARARGDKQKALAAFAAARKHTEATWGDKPKASQYFSIIAALDAGLGRKEEAIREAQRAVELMPMARDSYWGPSLVMNLALVYAWTGEHDRALDELEKVATIPNGPSYGELRFHPRWDDLRGNPRFDKIVAAAKAASR